MYRDFYATLAQVFPVLLLAFVWDSRYLEQLSRQTRAPRRHDPSGVRFWTKPRVRVYALTIVSLVVVDIAVATSVLSGVFPDSPITRAFLTAGLVLILGTLLTRIAVDIICATRVKPAGSPAPSGSEVTDRDETATDQTTT